jgi:dipeptidyl aminopeptidase/acylaminoacyl peptidase
MTDDRFVRELGAAMSDLAVPRVPEYFDDVLATTAQRRQRAPWTFPERWLPMDLTTPAVSAARLPWRQLGVLALVAVVIAATLAIYVGTRQERLPPPFGPAANGLIAASVGGDIHLIDPLTGRSTPIVEGPEQDGRVAVSPTGEHVVFEREQLGDDGATYELVVTGIDGSEPRAITVGRADGYESFAWSPDGRSILVHLPPPDGIWLYDALGDAEPRQVVATGSLYEHPFRPPDGSAILIHRPYAAVRQLLMVDLGTGQETVLVEGSAIGDDLMDARWSPDGSAVVYHAPPSGDWASQRLFIVAADGTGRRQLTDAPGVWWDIDPTWSPTGDRIAFDRYERVGPDWLVRQLAIVDVATGSVREVGPIPIEARRAAPNPADPGNPGEGFWFEWSPDGTALLAVPGEADAHPVLIDVATGAWRTLDPVIAPDFVFQAWQRKPLP